MLTSAIVVFALSVYPMTTREMWTAFPVPHQVVMPSHTQTPLSSAAELSLITELPNIGVEVDGVDPMNSIYDMIDAYGRLDDGWSGAGSIKPSRTHIAAAKELLSLVPSGVPLPHPMISAAGEVGFFWDSPNAFADVVIEPDGSFSLFTRTKGAVEVEAFADEVPIDMHASALFASHLAIFARA